MHSEVLIVTVTKVEAKAVLDLFQGATGRRAKPVPIEDKVYLDLGVINGTSATLVQSEMGSGGLGAALLTVHKAIEKLSPSAVIMVGIAFGANSENQAIGDILVSKQLMLYDLQRVGKGKGDEIETIARGDRITASTWLLDRFRNADLAREGAVPEVRFGLILTGEKLVDNIDFRGQLLCLEREAIGGEMEGAGLYTACQDKKKDWILVKGICDWADGHKGENRVEYQRLAAHNAAAFVLQMLQYAPLRTEPHASAELRNDSPPQCDTAAPARGPGLSALLGLSRRQAYRLLVFVALTVLVVAAIGIEAWHSATGIGGNTFETGLTQSPSARADLGIFGQVREEQEEVGDASILDIGGGGRTESDATGRFTLTVVETSPGWARIKVSKTGYETWEDYVRTTENIIVPIKRKP